MNDLILNMINPSLLTGCEPHAFKALTQSSHKKTVSNLPIIKKKSLSNS